MKNKHGGQTTCVVATWAFFKPNSIHTVAFYVVKSSSWLCEEASKRNKVVVPEEWREHFRMSRDSLYSLARAL